MYLHAHIHWVAVYCRASQSDAECCGVGYCSTGSREELFLQHTAIHCNTLQHTATHCNTLQHTATQSLPPRTRNSAAKLPTPPSPTTSTCDALSSRMPSLPISSSVLCNMCCSVLQCVAVCCSVSFGARITKIC